MKREIKYLLITGLIFILVLFLISYLLSIFNKDNDKNLFSILKNLKIEGDFSDEFLNSLSYKLEENKDYDFGKIDNIENINIDLLSVNIKILESDNENLKVKTNLKYHSTSEEIFKNYIKNYKREVSFDNNNLKIDFTMENGNDSFTMKKLIITGDIMVFIPKNIVYKSVIINIISGDISLLNQNIDELLNINSVSSNITIDNSKISKLGTIKIVSGNTNIKNSYLDSLYLSSVSGDIDLNCQNILKELDINSVSGDVIVSIKAYEKTFKAKTISGDLKIKIENDTINNSYILINTTSGNVIINNKRYNSKGEIIINKEISTKSITLNTVSGDIELNFSK